jgi:hypothetical protein
MQEQYHDFDDGNKGGDDPEQAGTGETPMGDREGLFLDLTDRGNDELVYIY